MSYNYSINRMDETIQTQSEDEALIHLPDELSFIKTRKKILSEDITLFKMDTSCFNDMNVSTQVAVGCLLIRITLNGNMSFCDSDKNTQNFIKNSIHIDYMNDLDGIYKMKKNMSNTSVVLCINEKFLNKHLFNNLKDKERSILEKNYSENITSHLRDSLANTGTFFLANELYNSPFKGELNDLYLQTKAYEIIYNEFSSLLNEKKNTTPHKIKFSNPDIEALHKAKKIMMTSKEKVSIQDLSRKIAINENKLKYGFRHLFNTTPYAVMLDSKMYEAKKLLSQSDLNVSEIANEVGYASVQSFSLAFFRKFGIRPKDIMKKRDYYY